MQNHIIDSKKSIAYLKILVLFFLLIVKCSIYSQNKKIDSLLNVLKITKEDTSKVNILNNIGQLYSNKGQQDSAEIYVNKALKIALSIYTNQNNEKGWLSGIASSYSKLGSIYFYKGDYKTANNYAFKALDIYTKNNDERKIAQVHYDIGIYYSLQSEFTKGIDYFFKALKTFELFEDKIGKSRCYYNIGNVYSNLKNYDEAIKYDLKALKINEELKNNEGIAVVLVNLGVAYLELKNNTNALDYFLRALKINETVGNVYLEANLMTNIGEAYTNEKQFNKAMLYYNNADSLFKKLGSEGDRAFVLQKIGKIHLENKNYSAAEKILLEGLTISNKTGSLQQISDGNNYLSFLYEKTGNPQKALDHYKKHIEYKDSIFNEANIKKVTQIEMNFEFEKKQLAAKTEQEKKELHEAEAAGKKKVIIIAAFILLIVIIVSIFFQNRMKRKKDKIIFENKQQLKEKENSILRLEKNQVEDELLKAKNALDNYMENILQKNELLENFKIEIENLRNLKSKELYEEKIEQLDSLSKIVIITEEDWDKFKILFEEVYKGFFTRLKDKFPQLTQSETRLICLTKLKLETKQMACILGVSPETVTKTRYRLRKKIDPNGEQALEEIITKI